MFSGVSIEGFSSNVVGSCLDPHHGCLTRGKRVSILWSATALGKHKTNKMLCTNYWGKHGRPHLSTSQFVPALSDNNGHRVGRVVPTHTYTHTHTITHQHTQLHSHTHNYTTTHTLTLTHTQLHNNTLTHTHNCTHTHTITQQHTQLHTHTHTIVVPQ